MMSRRTPQDFPQRLSGLLPDRAGPGRVLKVMDFLEQSPLLDPAVFPVRQAVRALPLGRSRDVLHGRWLGHPVHPLSVQMPIGAFFSAAVLDVLPRQRAAARTLIVLGVLSAGPAALTGWVDWAELRKPQARVGLLHAVTNLTAVSLYGASLFARLRGREARGRLLAFAGLTTIGIGGAVGGHLSYRQAAGVNQSEHLALLAEPGWHVLGPVEDFPLDQPVRHVLDGAALVIVRTQQRVYVLADQCSHMAGPLSRGELVDGCLRCPWHGSTFRLADGWNVTGPATAAQPAFDSRTRNGALEVRLR